MGERTPTGGGTNLPTTWKSRPRNPSGVQDASAMRPPGRTTRSSSEAERAGSGANRAHRWLTALGAPAGSRPQPDFEGLGVELKTLPVDPAGNPYESTFVCTIHPAELSDVEWDVSHVKRKLSRVLWLPIDGDRRRALGERRFGSPLLWSPDDDELSALRFDWEELAGLVARVGADLITAHVGRVLQIRPKARDSRARRRAFDVEGGTIAALPRGFYLRASFTRAILRRHFGLGA